MGGGPNIRRDWQERRRFRMGGRHRRYAIAVAVHSALTVSAALAVTASWVAPVDGSWTLAPAWSSNPASPDNSQPNPADIYYATISAAGSPYTVSLASDITIGRL